MSKRSKSLREREGRGKAEGRQREGRGKAEGRQREGREKEKRRKREGNMKFTDYFFWRPKKEKKKEKEKVVINFSDSVPFPEEEVSVMPVARPLKSFSQFIEAIGKRESSNDYTCKNEYGYLGKFQFGLARLTDFGLCHRKPGCHGWGNRNFEWTSPYTEHLFLANPGLQDAIFEAHVARHRKTITERYGKYLDTVIDDVNLDLSGAIACVHLLGVGGLRHFIAGEEASDANGTMASDYIIEFGGYEIPENLRVDI